MINKRKLAQNIKAAIAETGRKSKDIFEGSEISKEYVSLCLNSRAETALLRNVDIICDAVGVKVIDMLVGTEEC